MARRKRKGRAARRNKQLTSVEPEEVKNAPHSFVLHRGNVGRYLKELTKDFRKIMHPYTASSLKVRRKNTIKDFQSVAGLLHVTHHVLFTRTQLSTYFRIARFPRGPTLTFRVHNYSLARDVVSRMKKQYVFDRLFANSPLVVLNGFTGEGHHLKLMVTTFQNMFPSISLSKVNLSDIRRCVLLNYNPASKIIDFRHYAIKVVPKGISKSVKKMVQNKVPNLSRFEDMSEFFSKCAMLSESEAEDEPNSHVILPQNVPTRGNVASNQSAIRVMELGPRMSIQLLKVEEGLLSGEVLFHELIVKSEEEKKLIKKRRMERMLMKAKRKKIQEENKLKKERLKEEHKQRSLKGMKKLETDILMKKASEETNAARGTDDEDDDANWYRQEVGEEPSQDLFSTKPSVGVKRKKNVPSWIKRKKPKQEIDSISRGNLKKFGSKRGKEFSRPKWTVTDSKVRR
ncbi:protein Peter pan [Ischnura elegans]|uniref:protein Peter pan n=1 Tax=Ischnura elegans TaxID=197161 RepID=UPI001ED86A31|nr:protein Peter pan [Ischnura elegans]